LQEFKKTENASNSWIDALIV